MCETKITPRNETLDAVLIICTCLYILLLVKMLKNSKRDERVLFFTVDKEGNVTDEEEVTYGSDSGPRTPNTR